MERWTIQSIADLGRLVHSARKQEKLPLKKAALLCNVSIQFMHDLEHGKPTLQFDKAVAVARQMGLQLEAKTRRLEGLSDSSGQ